MHIKALCFILSHRSTIDVSESKQRRRKIPKKPSLEISIESHRITPPGRHIYTASVPLAISFRALFALDYIKISLKIHAEWKHSERRGHKRGWITQGVVGMNALSSIPRCVPWFFCWEGKFPQGSRRVKPGTCSSAFSFLHCFQHDFFHLRRRLKRGSSGTRKYISYKGEEDATIAFDVFSMQFRV